MPTVFIHVLLLFVQLFTSLNAAPHIVYFLVDDLGNGNVGFHNDEPITPHIDQLAKEGAILNRFYTYRFCSPTRSSFLSGILINLQPLYKAHILYCFLMYRTFTISCESKE